MTRAQWIWILVLGGAVGALTLDDIRSNLGFWIIAGCAFAAALCAIALVAINEGEEE